MKKLLTIILVFMMVFASIPISANAQTDYSAVRVKLTTNNATGINFGVSGEYFLNENGASFKGGTLSVSSNGDGTFDVSHSSGGLLYSGSTVNIKRAKMTPSAGYLRMNSKNYLGHFTIKMLSSGYLQVVNEVPMAHYLYGVVGGEMSNNLYGLDALKAQAIAAKGYVMYQMSLSTNSQYHIGDTSSDQVYKGYVSTNTNVIEAVDSTINEVLTAGGDIICTYYAASNGGETNLPTYAWPSRDGSDAGFALTLDNYDMRNSASPVEIVYLPINSQGTISTEMYEFMCQKAANALGEEISGINVIRSVEMHTPKYKGTSRNMTKGTMVVDVIIGFNVKENVSFSFNASELYTAGVFSNASLRTYWGEYSEEGDQYAIVHGRWGHGVGLSQRGAQQMASEGHSYKEILGFYYPGAKLASANIPMLKDPVKPVVSTPSPTLPVQSGNDAAVGTGTLTGDQVSLRSGPGTGYTRLARLAKGEKVEVYGKIGEWYKVKYKEYEGYISDAYIKFEAAATPTVSPTPESTSGGTGDFENNGGNNNTDTPIVSGPTPYAYGQLTGDQVNFRAGAGTGFAVLAKLKKDVYIELYKKEGDWYYAGYNGILGFVSADYVKEVDVYIIGGNTNPSPTPTVSPSTSPTVSNSPAQSAGKEIEKGVLTAGGVNFRTGPGTGYTSMLKLTKSTGAYIFSTVGEWYYVNINGQYGYVHKDYINITGKVYYYTNGSIVDPNVSSGTGAGVATGNVNLRAGASTDDKILEVVKKGSELTLYSLSNGWYKVKLSSGKEGYVSSKYVKVTTAIPENNNSSSGSANQGESAKAVAKGETVSNVNFREGPSTSTKKITQLSKGAKITIYSLDNGWYEVDYNGTKGYLSAEYVKITAFIEENEDNNTSSGNNNSSGNGLWQGGITPEGGSNIGDLDSNSASAKGLQLAVGVTTNEVNFRNRPSTKNSTVLSTFKAGVEVNILGENGDFYYILSGGKTGFAYKAYVKVKSSGTAGIPKCSPAVTLVNTTTLTEVNMRTGPATSYEKIRMLPKNAKLTVYMITNSWCLVKQDGDYGYVLGEYIKLN